MDLHEDISSDVYIKAYAEGSITVNGTVYQTSLVLSNTSVNPVPGLTLATITPDILRECLSDEERAQLECVVIGCGERQTHHPLDLIIAFHQQGLGCEVMTTPAACRTFNILTADLRKIVAILLID